jgi:hypothetical protein
VAAHLRELEVFQGNFNLAIENLTTEEVNKKFLAPGNEGRTVFHVAAQLRELVIFQGIFNLAKRI